MHRLLSKLLLLFAVLLMPLGMGAAPASAAAQHSVHAMPIEHCPGDKGKHAGEGIGACTMACAAALPAALWSGAAPLLHADARQTPRLAEPLVGLHPETATPPPRVS